MPENACSALSFSPQGKLLARHANLPFVTELDGFRVNVMPAPSAPNGHVYQSPGGQLWAVAPGGLEEFRGNSGWFKHNVPVLSGLGAADLDTIQLYPIRQDLVLILIPDQLIEFNSQSSGGASVRSLRTASETALGKFTGLTRARSTGLWIAGDRGLARIPGPLRNLTPDTQWIESILPDTLELKTLRFPVENGALPPESQPESRVLVTALAQCRTNANKCLLTFDGSTFSPGKFEDSKITRAWRGPERTIFLMGNEGLWQTSDQDSELTECDEVPARRYYDFTSEPSGAFWIATAEGLFRYAPLLWQTERAARKISSPVRCLATDQDKNLCFVSGNRFYVMQSGGLLDYPLPSYRDRIVQARALYLTASGTLILVAEDPESARHELLFRFQATRGAFGPLNLTSGRLRALGLLRDGSLCVQRTLDATHSDLQKYDGRSFQPLSESPPESLGNNFVCIYSAQNGDFWVSTELGTGCLHEREWRTYPSADKSNPDRASAFVELPDGRIWCAVDDQVWEYDGRKWSVTRRGFDRVNALLRGKDGSIWVASNSGLTRYLRDAWVENGLEEGLPSTTVRDLLDTERGLWAATSRGLSLFHPEADPETDTPQTYVQKLSQFGATGPEGGTVTITYGGRDKWKYTAKERLLYSYRLDDKDWSPFQDSTRITFTDLSPGNHYFQVRSMDRNCNVDPRPAQYEFAIVLPWYKETRSLAIACAGAAVALFFAAVAFNRHRQLVRSYAEVEAKVAERTRQLELASQELFHSQKMNALGTLAAGVAHDFNNILSIIKGSAQLIEDNIDNPQKIQIRADRIKTVVEQGAGIVKAMLGFSRESGPLDAPCDINRIVENTLKLLGDRFLREVEVRFGPSPGLPVVSGSKEFLQQIMLNLIFNAAESMQQPKVIHLSTSLREQLPAGMPLAPVPASSFVVVSVQDHGCGISPENLSRIFEPFFTTKAFSARRGTGLGLSMVYELAKKLGAGLSVSSAVDQGSTFSLWLPIREPKSEKEP